MTERGFKKSKKIRKKNTKKINKPKKTSKKVNLTVKIEKPKIKIVRNKKIVKNTKKIENVENIEKKNKELAREQTIENLEQAEVVYEKIEKDKKMMLIAGVSFFMVLIGGFWIYNIKQVFQQTAESIENNSEISSLAEMTDELSGKIVEMKNGLEKIKEFENQSENATTTMFATTTLQVLPESEILSSTTISTTTLSQKLELEILKQKIKELEDKIK